MNLDPQLQQRLLPLKESIAARFTSENWLDLGAITASIDIVQNHPRLLRSLSWDDEDYPSHVMSVIVAIVSRDPANFARIENYVRVHCPSAGESVSSVDTDRRIVFSPTVFEVPATRIDRSLVAVMMPFDDGLKPVYEAISKAARDRRLRCARVDDIWNHSTVIQDIFDLIFRSHIVICDFTDRNPNVFYECGIAHTLGKHVVPIAQHDSDVPFDLRHHRYLRYLKNAEGLEALRKGLSSRLATLSDHDDDEEYSGAGHA